MKTFGQFCQEAYDPEIAKRSQIRQTGEGGRKQPKRDTESRRRPGVKPRVKAVGGGKTAPVGEYKTRKDVGKTQAKSDTVQQPTKERGSAEVKQSYADKVKAERKKAAQARAAARKSGGEVKKSTTSSKDAEKQASQLLKKKSEKKVSPDYKPQKASGYTRQERMKIHRKGETVLRNTFKDQETAKYKKETGQNPDAKGRTKIMGRVHKRMSEAVDDVHSTTYGSGMSPQSGTIGGSKAAFKKRPSTGLSNLAKRAGQSIKNAGKNTAGSEQKPKDTTYRNKVGKKTEVVDGPKKTTADKVKTAAKTAAQKRLPGNKPKPRPMLGSAQRPDLIKGRKPSPQLSAAPQRPAISGTPERKAISGTPNRPSLPAQQQRKALPAGR